MQYGYMLKDIEPTPANTNIGIMGSLHIRGRHFVLSFCSVMLPLLQGMCNDRMAILYQPSNLNVIDLYILNLFHGMIRQTSIAGIEMAACISWNYSPKEGNEGIYWYHGAYAKMYVLCKSDSNTNRIVRRSFMLRTAGRTKSDWRPSRWRQYPFGQTNRVIIVTYWT